MINAHTCNPEITKKLDSEIRHKQWLKLIKLLLEKEWKATSSGMHFCAKGKSQKLNVHCVQLLTVLHIIEKRSFFFAYIFGECIFVGVNASYINTAVWIYSLVVYHHMSG